MYKLLVVLFSFCLCINADCEHGIYLDKNSYMGAGAGIVGYQMTNDVSTFIRYRVKISSCGFIDLDGKTSSDISTNAHYVTLIHTQPDAGRDIIYNLGIKTKNNTVSNYDVRLVLYGYVGQGGGIISGVTTWRETAWKSVVPGKNVNLEITIPGPIPTYSGGYYGGLVFYLDIKKQTGYTLTYDNVVDQSNSFIYGILGKNFNTYTTSSSSNYDLLLNNPTIRHDYTLNLGAPKLNGTLNQNMIDYAISKTNNSPYTLTFEKICKTNQYKFKLDLITYSEIISTQNNGKLNVDCSIENVLIPYNINTGGKILCALTQIEDIYSYYHDLYDNDLYVLQYEDFENYINDCQLIYPTEFTETLTEIFRNSDYNHNGLLELTEFTDFASSYDTDNNGCP